jgi:ATP-dependent DNA helicase RecG
MRQTVMTYTDIQLLDMLRQPESQLVERKESLEGKASKTIRQAICAFANDLPNHKKPGVIFVGVKDNGDFAGLPTTDDLLLTLSQMKSDGNLLPIPTISVEKRTLAGNDVAVVFVQPADRPPTRCYGEIWVRVGPSRARATAQDERILNEKRRYGDLPFDLQPVDTAKLNDLSKARFEEEYLPQAFSSDVLAANERSYEQRLASLRLINSVEDATPTVLGLLVLGKRTRDFLPGAYIQFLRIDGQLLSDPIIDESEIDGSITDVARKLDEKIDAHNMKSVNYTNQNGEVSSTPYPKAALQQLSRNAILHRVYEDTNAPIRLSWFNDRIEIISPGGPFGLVNQNNFGNSGVSDYRNRYLADAMHVLGLVQRFGTGIAIARKAMEENGNPALEFTVTADFVTSVMRAKS